MIAPADFLPTTLSCRRDSPFWREDVFDLGKAIIITIDGVEQRKVVEFDTTAGRLTRLAVDADGNVIRNAQHTAIVEETITGDVRVFWKSNGK